MQRLVAFAGPLEQLPDFAVAILRTNRVRFGKREQVLQEIKSRGSWFTLRDEKTSNIVLEPRLMNSLRARCRNLLFHAKHFQLREIGHKLAIRACSNTSTYCLRRDLEIPFPAPEARIPISVRRLADDDIPKVFGNMSKLPVPDRADLYARWAHWNADIPTCYVAVTGDGVPAYVQWLMGPEQNEKIQAYFNGTFPVLAPDEALLENALALPEFRGKGIMPAAMARIAEQAKSLGARYVLTFVERHQVRSLKGCKKAGFVPYMMRQERWVLFRRSLTFTTLPKGTPYPFDAQEATPQTA